MRIIRVFPKRTKATPTDNLAFVGPPPLWLPEGDEVHVSVTFTWDKPKAEDLADSWAMHYPTIRIGGPAYDDPGAEFVPGRYLGPGYVITTRGCPNHCGFCLVPKREGPLRCLPIVDGWNVLDNNLLAAPHSHIEDVLTMLGRQRHRAEFTGGLEARRLERWFVQDITDLHFKRVYLAYDKESDRKPMIDAVRLLREFGHPYYRISVYVLCGYDGDTVEAAEKRMQTVKEVGAVPWPMYYQPPDKQQKAREWKDFIARLITKPGLMKARE